MPTCSARRKSPRRARLRAFVVSCVAVSAAFAIAVARSAFGETPSAGPIEDVREHGARGDGVHDDTKAILAAVAALPPAGGTVRFPEGVYGIGAAPIVLRRANVRFLGTGAASVLRKLAPGAILLVPKASTDVAGLQFRGLRFEFAPAARERGHGIAISIAGGARNLTIDACDFRGFPDYGLLLTNVAGAMIDRCTFTSPGDARGTAIEIGGNPRGIVVRNSRFAWVRNGFIVAANAKRSETATDITLEDNHFDLGWWLIQPIHRGEGPSVTYGATSLTDRTARFRSLGLETSVKDVFHDVRVLPLRRRGVGHYAPTTLTDAEADFVQAGAKKGEIVRSGDRFAVLARVDSPTEIALEGWLSQSTYEPVAPPPPGSEYSLFGVYIGQIAGVDDQTLDVGKWGKWFDLAGNRVTPAPGTRYEILVRRPNYPCHAESGTSRIAVRGNTFLRGWSDQVSMYGNEATITNNRIEYGEDMGITLHGRGNVVSGNVIRSQGAAGLWIKSDDSTIEDNEIFDSRWVNRTAPDLSDLVVRGGESNRIRRNRCGRPAEPTSCEARSPTPDLRSIPKSGEECHGR